MRGSLKQRYKGSWSIILDLGYQTDPTTGKKRRRQKWITFHGTEQQADRKLNELVGKAQRNEFVEPTKITLGEHLDAWLEKAIKPPRKRQRTYDSYKNTIRARIQPAIGGLRLQGLQAEDLERYYAEQSDLAPASLQLHHTILSSALKSAVKSRLLYRNVAADVEGKPRKQCAPDEVINATWSAADARTFLATAKAAGPQLAAFYALALDSGARQGELLGLRWTDVNLDTGSIRIVQQLIDHGRRSRGPDHPVTAPTFGPTKSDSSRRVDLGAETIQLLREHKRQQAELKMKNRDYYHDLGLVFAREPADLFGHPDALGWPLPAASLGRHTFHALITTADVSRIKFHGLRHTSASLLLEAGVAMKVVSERLGHAKIAITMDIYSHVAPAMQRDAAVRLGHLLYGTGS
jgi:integrase